MSSFENIVGAIHDLSYEAKLKLRVVLDDELNRKPAKPNDKTGSSLVGLLADEPELADQIMESVYEHRSRLLRLEGK